MKTCENCQYATEYPCSHEKMSRRPTYSEDERGTRVFAPICEHYTEIVAEPVPIESAEPTAASHITVAYPLDRKGEYDADVTKYLNSGYQPLKDSMPVDGYGVIWLVQTLVRVE